MSIKYLNLVWEKSRAKGGALVVMLALADMANDDGDCFPGQSKLAVKCRMSERGLQATLYKLQDAGEIKIHVRRVERNRNLTNIYTITLGGDASGIPPQQRGLPPSTNPDSSSGRIGVRPVGEAGFVQWTNRDSWNPSIDPSLIQKSDPDHLPRPNLILQELQKRKKGTAS